MACIILYKSEVLFMTKQDFQQRMEQGILLLDGATGSNLLKAGMPRGVCTEQWIAEHPKPLIELQKAYVEAGSFGFYIYIK